MLQGLRTLKGIWNAHHRFSNDSNHFILLDYFITASGIRFATQTSELYKAFRLVVFVSTTMVSITLWHNFSKWESFGIVLNSLHVCLTIIVVVGRGIWFQLHTKEFQDARNYINGRRFRPNDYYSTEIRRKAYQRNHKVATFCGIVQLLMSIPLVVIDLKRIPSLTNPIQIREWIGDGSQFVLDKVHAFFLFPLGAIAVTNVLTPYMLLKGFIVEMQIIASSFKETFDSRANDMGVDYWQELQANFKTCAEQHVICLNHLRSIRPLLNGTLLIMYFTTGVFIPSGAIYIMWTKRFDLYMIQILYAITFNVVECYGFSVLMERVTHVHNSVGEQIYNLAWHTELKYSESVEKEYRSIRATMLIVMHSAEHSLGISCGGLFELGMERFSEMVKSSYQLIMFLWNFTDA